MKSEVEIHHQYLKELLSNVKLDQFIKFMKHPTLLFHENGTLLYRNEAAFRIFSIKENQSLYSSTWPFASKQFSKEQSMFKKQDYIGEKLYEWSVRRINLNEACFFMETVTPAEEVYHEDNLESKQREMERIIHSVHDGIFITDEKGFTLQINKRYSEMTGIRQEEVKGRHVSELVYEGFFDDSITLKVLEKKETVSILQKIKNGNQIWLVTGNPIIDSKGNLIKILNTVHDMTELNRLRESLKIQEIENNNHRRELQALRSQITEIPGLIGNSQAIRSITSKIRKIADIPSTILLFGETGCGKNVVATAIHQLSERKEEAFIEVNCGAIPEHLIESELFGYANGAFTGAAKGGKPGLFEVAHKGTVFLDEIGEMPLSLQVKLLTFLQDRKIRRVGDTNNIEVDVRIIAATHKNLKQLVEEKKFREDLYYRLTVIPLFLPSLRERKEDIYQLSNYFLNKYNQHYKRTVQFSKGVYLSLENYEWPGNVRELQHLIEQLVVLAEDHTVTVSDLPNYIQKSPEFKTDFSGTLKDIIGNVEYQMIKSTWEEIGDIQQVAHRLGMHRTTLIRKANKLGVNFN
ncbi:sigma 54-interacting transcriptional regulator [Fictibacillus enclensis]|uniref:sigma-54 interaction domain-containing protein n=1 Tax=Fictibacillus enclensis TaxID=1017270 RepID=UPI0025A2BF49|nr:sigma 54-interacting transcriptional regulator [Fictibacillus enclensis]MDM5338551.1 sigma 54-interacting transcriptional regulator [Fictibacillus enclensis]